MKPGLSLWKLNAFLLTVLIFGSVGCVKRSRTHPAPFRHQLQGQQVISQPTGKLININTASANELETLPGIGKSLAVRIIEHREKYGGFRRPEHLIIVRGISDRRFRAMRELIAVE